MNWPKFVKEVLATKKLGGEEKRILLAVVAMIAPNDHGELTQSEIGKVVGMTQPSVSATLKLLVEKDFLTKVDAPRGNHKDYGLGSKSRSFMS